MKKMARVLVVLMVLATLAAGQSTLMAAPTNGAAHASEQSGLFDRMLNLFGAIWGAGIWGGAIWGAAIWGTDSEAGRG